MVKQLFVFSMFGVLALALITQPVAAQETTINALPNENIVGTLLTMETFDTSDAWEQYSDPMGVELGVENGVYRAYTMNGGYVWGLNEQQYSDVLLEVEAIPMNVNFGNAFGVMCRATTDGDGYYFMINANGQFSIAMGAGDYIVPLLDWQPSAAINSEIDRNVIRASCIGDELSLYVNDEFVAEVSDATYSTGFAGLSIAAADNYDADVAFDNLAIYSPITAG